jgi:hypothetical protein
MVRHETPGEDADLAVFYVELSKAEVGEAIGAGKEDVLAVYPALGDVVDFAGFDAAGISGHIIRELGQVGETLK